MFTIALPKGALLKDSISTFKRAGLDFSDALNENNRSLTFESNCKRAKALLVRNGDVPVYVSYGQADLGIVGYDVLRESELKVAKLLDLGFGHKRSTLILYVFSFLISGISYFMINMSLGLSIFILTFIVLSCMSVPFILMQNKNTKSEK